MQEGWKRRREMEAVIGRRALGRARRLERVPASIAECRSEEERVAYALDMAQADELDELAARSDVVAFAVRASLEEDGAGRE